MDASTGKSALQYGPNNDASEYRDVTGAAWKQVLAGL
jgi:hypothetical protein